MFRASFTSQSREAAPSLFAGDFPRVSRVVAIAAGSGALEAGAVLGRIAAGGKFTLSRAAAADGSEDPSVILGEPVDATDADVPAVVYLTGDYRPDALTFGAGHSADSTRAPLRALSIFF